MKNIRRIATLMLILLLVFCSVPAGAYYYSSYYSYIVGYYDEMAFDDEFAYSDPYLVSSTFYESGNYLIYMYDKPSSSGQPISEYVNHTVLKVIELYPQGHKDYAYVIGPDGYRGFVRRAWITDLNEYYNAVPYIVTSEFYENGAYRAYMYPTPSSGGNPNGDYVNGTIVYVLDYYGNTKYAKCLGPDGNEGYIRKTRLTPLY